jgi:hypothetical protein
MDDGVAEVQCKCGQKLMVHSPGDRSPGEHDECENCGRRYDLVQYIAVTEAVRRCEWCDKWIHGTQLKRLRYCSEKCGVLARKKAKEPKA